MAQRRSSLLVILAIAMAFASPFFSTGNVSEKSDSGESPELGTWTRHLHLTGTRRTEFFPHSDH
eukprot:CAMPEP_0114656748 /NCGR_PEP_ID=MMETSP0191-20121206/12843_1 /TAXON_ID=126664 /ORGANISM="Sorites sp." /LENGTH=63 /DNA_ID=CAMNT_0001874651 /DNA_START=67 /DNA_END=258 /DNA_ORIENTATION=+